MRYKRCSMMLLMFLMSVSLVGCGGLQPTKEQLFQMTQKNVEIQNLNREAQETGSPNACTATVEKTVEYLNWMSVIQMNPDWKNDLTDAQADWEVWLERWGTLDIAMKKRKAAGAAREAQLWWNAAKVLPSSNP